MNPIPATNKPNQTPPPPPPLDKEASELLHVSINNAHDFLGSTDARIPTALVCIKVPELPAFVTDHIDRDEQTQLACELIDWLLTANGDGPLLRRKRADDAARSG